MTIGGLVVARQRPGTAKGIVFILLEDEFGTVNLIVPPQVYERHRLIVRSEPLLLALGRLEKLPIAGGAINVYVRELRALAEPGSGGAEVVPLPERGAPAPCRGEPAPAPWAGEAPPTTQADFRGVAPAVQSFAAGRRRDRAVRTDAPRKRIRSARWPYSRSCCSSSCSRWASFFVGMAGGPKGARQRIQTQTRRGRRGATLLFVATVVLLGIACPGRGHRDREEPQLDPRGQREGAHGAPGARPRAVQPALQELPRARGSEGDRPSRAEPGRAAARPRRSCSTRSRRAARQATATWPPGWSRARTPRPSRSSSRSPSASRRRRVRVRVAAPRDRPLRRPDHPFNPHVPENSGRPRFRSAGPSATMSCGSARGSASERGETMKVAFLQGISRLLRCPAASAEFPSDTGSGGPR